MVLGEEHDCGAKKKEETFKPGALFDQDDVQELTGGRGA